jgi:hypothetical protein
MAGLVFLSVFENIYYFWKQMAMAKMALQEGIHSACHLRRAVWLGMHPCHTCACREVECIACAGAEDLDSTRYELRIKILQQSAFNDLFPYSPNPSPPPARQHDPAHPPPVPAVQVHEHGAGEEQLHDRQGHGGHRRAEHGGEAGGAPATQGHPGCGERCVGHSKRHGDCVAGRATQNALQSLPPMFGPSADRERQRQRGPGVGQIRAGC